MGKGYVIALVIVGICCLVLFMYVSESPLEQQLRLRHVYFLTLRARASHYWLRLKLKRHPCDFISQSTNVEEDMTEKKGKGKGKGKGEKVKEAVEKSFEKTKSTVEDSAKSAGKIAREAAGKVKESLSEHSSLSDPQVDEL